MITLNGISKKIMRWARENQVLRLKTKELLRVKTARNSSDDGPPVNSRSYQDQCVFHAQQGGAGAVECQLCKDDEDEAEDEDEDGDEYQLTVSEEDQFLPCVMCAKAFICAKCYESHFGKSNM